MPAHRGVLLGSSLHPAPGLRNCWGGPSCAGTTPDTTKATLGAGVLSGAFGRLHELLVSGKRMACLQARDQEERAEWTSRFRESTQTLGVIIEEVFQARDAHCIPLVGSEPTGASNAGAPIIPSRTTPTSTSPSKFVAGKAINGKRVAKVMRDGTILCQNFQ
jgi:hypothetical protein